jgi:Ca2+-binding RTX toxin-like protein
LTNNTYHRFGIVNSIKPKLMTGKTGSAMGNNADVWRFSTGNLSNRLETNKTLNLNMVEQGSDPNIRAYMQAMVQPTMTMGVNGNILVQSSRMTSATGFRDTSGKGSLDHKGIDVNRASGGKGEPFRSTVDGIIESVDALSSGISRITIKATDGTYHDFLHGNNYAVTKGQDVTVGQVLGNISDVGAAGRPHVHYQIRASANFKDTISIADYAAQHSLNGALQQTLALPDGAGTLTLAVGQINLTTAGGQTFGFDLNSTNVSNLRYEAATGDVSLSMGGGLIVRIVAQATGNVGGMVVLPNGDSVNFSRNGLSTYSDGSLVLSDGQGNLRSLRPGVDTGTGQHAWIDEVMTLQQSIDAFGHDVLIDANGQDVPSDNSYDPNSEPLPGGGQYWFGAEAPVDARVINVSYNTQYVDGVEYQIHPNGGLFRELPGGYIEWRDPGSMDGGITNLRGEPALVLNAEDHVSLSDNALGFAVGNAFVIRPTQNDQVDVSANVDGRLVSFSGKFEYATDDTGMPTSSLDLFQIISIGGQSVLNGSMVNSAFTAGNYDLGDLLGQSSTGTGYAIPSGLASLIAYADPANTTGTTPAPSTDGKPWYESDTATHIGGVLTSVQSLIASIKTGNPLPITTDFFNLAASASNNPDLQYSAIGQGLGAVNSLSNFGSALRRGDDFGAFMSGASVAKYVVQLNLTMAGQTLLKTLGDAPSTLLQERFEKDLRQKVSDKNTQEASKALSHYEEIKGVFDKLNIGVSVLNIHSSFSQGGNDLGKAQAVVGLLSALNAAKFLDAAWAGPAGWALAIIGIASDVFGSSPDVWGNAVAAGTGDARHVNAVQWGLDNDHGIDTAKSVLNGLISALEDALQRDPALDMNGLGIIARRLPGVHFKGNDSGSGYLDLNSYDPANNDYLSRRFGMDGKAAIPDATSADYFKDMATLFVEHGYMAGAIAPRWMVRTAEAQLAREAHLARDDQLSGLTTEQRAAKLNQLRTTNPGDATPNNAGHNTASSTQTARLIVLDLDDNGIHVTGMAQGGSVMVDVDGDGFAEQTEWLSPREGILVLDRNGDGQIEGGHEMFNDPTIDTLARGLGALDELDANGDHKLDASDFVYSELKVWQDIVQDGVMQDFEVVGLSSIGISELNITTKQFVMNGHSQTMDATALVANSGGEYIHAVGNSLLVASETGDVRLMASALADFGQSGDAAVRTRHSHVSSNGTLSVVDELMDGLEDTTIVVSVEQLLKNDASTAGGTLSLAQVGGARGGTVSLDAANGVIRFVPTADFNGEASFRYLVTDAQGQQTTGKALVNVAAVDDGLAVTARGATRVATAFDFAPTGGNVATLSGGEIAELALPARMELGAVQTFAPGQMQTMGAINASSYVGVKDGQWYVGTSALSNDWQPARVRLGNYGAVQALDPDSTDTLTYELLVDARYGQAEIIDPNIGLWRYTPQEGLYLPPTNDAFVVKVSDGHGGKTEFKVLVTPDFGLTGSGQALLDSDIVIDPGAPAGHIDLLTGGSGDDDLYGGDGDDVLDGGSGNDYLQGDTGNDQLIGGDGNDELTGVSGNDALFGDGGDDVLYGGEGDDALNGGSGNDYLQGDTGNDVLAGDDGDDTLAGGVGTDQMNGGVGNDTYYVDAAGDTTNEAAGAGTDTVLSSIGWTLAANVENLTLTGPNAINGTGNAEDNILKGNAAANTLDGAAGADTMLGGLGDDIYVVDSAGDSVIETVGEGVDTVRSSVSYTLSANVENLTLNGTADLNATGNALNNILTGNAGTNVLYGGAGNDTYYVDNVGDVTTEAASNGTDTVVSSMDWTLATNLENLTLSGSGNLQATGNSAANVLDGNAGNNLLDGGAGADTMKGSLGDDTYVVDSTGDVVTEDANKGTDLVMSAVSYTLTANVENLSLSGTAAINGTGNAQINVITGNAGNNTLLAVGSGDTLDGGDGDDVLGCGVTDQNTIFIGSKGNDTITGGNRFNTYVFNKGRWSGHDFRPDPFRLHRCAQVRRGHCAGRCDLCGGGR